MNNFFRFFFFFFFFFFFLESVEALRKLFFVARYLPFSSPLMKKQTFDISDNHKNLREALKESVPPVIPYVGLYSKLLLNMEESLSTYLPPRPDCSEKILNFHKVWLSLFRGWCLESKEILLEGFFFIFFPLIFPFQFRLMMDIFKQIGQYAGLFSSPLLSTLLLTIVPLLAVPYSIASNERIKSCLNGIPLYDEAALYKHSVEVCLIFTETNSFINL